MSIIQYISSLLTLSWFTYTKVEDFGLVASQQYLKLDRHDINLEDMKLMNLHVKTRLCNRWSSMNRNFTKCQKRLFKSFHQYQVQHLFKYFHFNLCCRNGDVAQMVERSLSMREVPGSIPGISTFSFFFLSIYAGCAIHPTKL